MFISECSIRFGHLSRETQAWQNNSQFNTILPKEQRSSKYGTNEDNFILCLEKFRDTSRQNGVTEKSNVNYKNVSIAYKTPAFKTAAPVSRPRTDLLTWNNFKTFTSVCDVDFNAQIRSFYCNLLKYAETDLSFIYISNL